MSALDPMTTPPERFGIAGRAWRVDLAAYRRAQGLAEEDPGVLVHWIVEAPRAHPLWHSFSLSLIHLRPHPVLPEPTLYADGVTHEVLLQVLDPAEPREPLLDGARPRWLQPANYAGQVTEASDEAAIARVASAVDRIVIGELSPDTDYRRDWIALFGDNMIRPEWKAAS
jgi:hypothetical protein